jgi:cytochrome P450
MVFQEALRLYPQPPGLSRTALHDDVLAGCLIPQGADVFVNTYSIQRDPRFWPNPEVFDPLRFSDERKQERQASAYLPFGHGQRACVGARLANLEATIVLAMLAQRFELDPLPGREVKAELLAALQPRGGLPMILRRRRRANH